MKRYGFLFVRIGLALLISGGQCQSFAEDEDGIRRARLDEIERDFQKSENFGVADLYPGIPGQGIRLSNRALEGSYSNEVDLDWGLWDLVRVPEDKVTTTNNRLDRLRKSRLFDVTRPSAERAFYTRSVDLRHARILPSDSAPMFRFDKHGLNFSLGSSWSTLLKDQRPIELFLRCSVSIDKDGYPIDAPLLHATPFALLTDKATYLFRSNGRVTVQMANSSFYTVKSSLQIKQHDIELIAKVETTLRENLQRRFEQPPFGARLLQTPNSSPEMLRFRRERQESHVLSGLVGPYRELSTYIVLCTVRRIHGTFPGKPIATTPVVKTDFFTINVEVISSVLLAVGSGIYEEPSRPNAEKYHSAITAAVDDALAELYKRWNAQIENGVGVIK